MRATFMATISTLILSTIKTDDVRITDRFSREVKKKEELYSNLLIVNYDSLQSLKISSILILNQNATPIDSSSLIDFIETKEQRVKIKSEFYDLLCHAEIINCNDFTDSHSDCFTYFNSINSKNIVLVEELLDSKFLHFVSTKSLKPNNLIMLAKNNKVYKNRVKEKIVEIFNDILQRNDEFRFLDENDLYCKYLFELIDEKRIRTYIEFLTKKSEQDALYYIYGEDLELLESIRSKTKKEFDSDKLTYLPNFNPEENDIVLNEFVLLDLVAEKKVEPLIQRIKSFKGSGTTFIIIDKSKHSRIQIGNTIYIPNYRELKRYHSSFFFYYSHCNIYSIELYKVIEHCSNLKDIVNLLGDFSNLKELISFTNSLNFKDLEQRTNEEIENYLISELTNTIEKIKLASMPNSIKYRDGHWFITFKGTEYDAGEESKGIKILIEMLPENQTIRSSKLRKKIDKQSVDLKADFEALWQGRNRIISKIKDIESKQKPRYLLSEYLKSKISFKKNTKQNTYYINSENITPNEWQIKLPSWYKT